MRHDGLAPSFIKVIAEEICLPLTIIINKSLETGSVPEAMKVASPVYKKGERTEFNN